jgi:DNA-binding transcriptional LysR family regulator
MSRPPAKVEPVHAEPMEWDDARYVLAIHRTGSLSDAGRTLGVNQSTVGRRLDALEAALEARLFFRTREGYVLTPEGERLLSHAERMEAEAQAIMRELRGQETRLSGVVRVTAPDAMTARLVVPILARLRARNPGIELAIVADNRTLSLTKREADLAIRVGRVSDEQLAARRICGFASAPYASKGYVEARGLPRAPSFEGHDFLGSTEYGGGEARWLADHALKGFVLSSTSTPTILSACLAGMGIALLPCYLGDTTPDLVRLGPKGGVTSSTVWLLVHRDLKRTPRVRVCADFLVEGLREHAAAFEGRVGASSPTPREASG